MMLSGLVIRFHVTCPTTPNHLLLNNKKLLSQSDQITFKKIVFIFSLKSVAKLHFIMRTRKNIEVFFVSFFLFICVIFSK